MELSTITLWITENPSKTCGLFVLSLLGCWVFASYILLLISPKLIFDREESKNTEPDIPYQQLWLTDEKDLKIDTVWFPNKNAKQVVLYLHGNRGRLNHFFPQLVGEYNVLAPAYPGYHKSTGKPNYKNIYSTGLLAYDYLIAQGFMPDQIIIFGHSLGGSPAVYTAANRPNLGKLVIVNTFSSMYDMCWDVWGIFCLFSKPLFNTQHYAPFVHGKVRQYHYINDTVVPYRLGEKLFTYFTGTTDKKFTPLTGALEHSEFDVLSVVKI